MSQTQLYWIIGAVVVLIALGILFALMSRRGRADEGAVRRDTSTGHAGLGGLSAAGDRAPMIGNADVRTPDVAGAAERETALNLPAFGEPAAPAAAVTPAPALAAFNVNDADRAAEQKAAEQKSAGQKQSTERTGLSGLSLGTESGAGADAVTSEAPAAGLTLRKATPAPKADLGDAGLSLRKPADEPKADLPVDPLEAALAASPETEMTAAEIAAEAAASVETAPKAAVQTAPKTEAPQADAAPALGLAAAGVAGGSGVTLDEKDGGVELPKPVASTPQDRAAAAAPATQAMPVVGSDTTADRTSADHASHDQASGGLAAAGVAGGAGVTLDEAEKAAAPAAPQAPAAPKTPDAPAAPKASQAPAAPAPAAKVGTPTPIGTSMSHPTTSIPSVNAPAKPAPAAPLADTTPAVAAPSATTPAADAPRAPREEQVPQDARIDGTPGLPGRIAMGEPVKDEAVAVTPHGDSREAVQARREAGVAAPGMLGKVAETVKDKAAPLVERTQPLTQKAAPLAEKAKDTALPLVEKAKDAATPLVKKAVSLAKDKLAQAQNRRWGRS